MQMKIQIHKSLLVSFLFFFMQEQYEQLMQQLHKCISVQMAVGQIHLLRVGWRDFFSSCGFVSVFGSGGKQALVLHTYVLRVQYSCGVVLVFWFCQEIVFGVTYVLSVLYSCAVVSVFWLWWEIDLKMRTRFYKKILLGYFFLLLRISFLYCIKLHPYSQDLSVEVKIGE